MFLFQLKVETYLGVRSVLQKKKLQLIKVTDGRLRHAWSMTSLLCCIMARDKSGRDNKDLNLKFVRS